VIIFGYREQQRSRELDILTGFQLMDGDKHIFVLEGLRDQAIIAVWENVPAPENSGKMERCAKSLSLCVYIYIICYYSSRQVI
jgi:hypothetical protein